MSLFDSASLVVTPNGYKEDKLYAIKPDDGSGDLVVTRATTATRVNSDGLIEQVPYNFLQQSQTFDNAAWNYLSVGGASIPVVTANSTTAPDGNLTADKIVFNAPTSGDISVLDQNISLTGTATGSFYIKAFSSTDIGKIIGFRFNSGSYSLVTLTDSWQRVSVTATALTTFDIHLRPAIGTSSGTVSIYLWGAQLVRGTSAKEYFPTTDRLDVPRLDYTNSSCPSILVEPQRTNLVTYSEAFNDTSWNVASTSTVTLNSGIAPNGTNTANLITATSVDGRRIKSLSLSAGTYTYSYFVKKGNQSSIQVLAFNSTLSAVAQSATFDLDNGTLTSGTGTIQQFTNGWYKVSVTFTIAATNTILLYIKSGLANNAIGSTVYAWGAQLEAGSYATSYIPTVGSTVTRNADVISKTGISDLIGQTEGTIFVDVTLPNTSANDIFTFDNLGVNDVFLASNGGYLLGRIYYNGNPIFFAQYAITSSGGRFKMLITYKSGNSSFYVNGTLLSNNTTSFSFTNTLSTINLTNSFYAGANKRDYNSVQLYKTALTDQECINLTTI